MFYDGSKSQIHCKAWGQANELRLAEGLILATDGC